MDDTATRDTQGIARGCTGGHTGDGTILTVTLGFKPQYVDLLNVTDVVKFMKIDGMPDNATYESAAAGANTIDTTGAITLTETGFTVAAAVNIDEKVFLWAAW